MMNLSQQWEALYRLHSRTKHYLLVAEELSEEGDVFLQPLKEHRDAYDHIIRACGAEFCKEFKTEDEKTAYILKNMDKAYGHEYRAFYDTADWLSFICRRYIRTILRNQKEKNLREFAEYKSIKKLINEVPLQIAKLREGKDIGKASSDEEQTTSANLIDEYCATLDELVRAYIAVHDKFDKA